jgi:hypothetical protein
MSFMAIPYLACMALVAVVYHLPPRVLPAIQAVEGGTVGNVSQNVDGSSDLGVMQVNTLWLLPGRVSASGRTRCSASIQAIRNTASDLPTGHPALVPR